MEPIVLITTLYCSSYRFLVIHILIKSGRTRKRNWFQFIRFDYFCTERIPDKVPKDVLRITQINLKPLGFGAWVAQSIRRPPLDFGLGQNLRVLRNKQTNKHWGCPHTEKRMQLAVQIPHACYLGFAKEPTTNYLGHSSVYYISGSDMGRHQLSPFSFVEPQPQLLFQINCRALRYADVQDPPPRDAGSTGLGLEPRYRYFF